MKHSGIPLESLPEHLRKQIEDNEATHRPHFGLNPPALAAAPRRRIRQNQNPVLNKLEEAAQFWLMSRGHVGLLAQAIRLELARGIWYKPDFFDPSALIAFEVKGPRAFRGGFENLKVAARAHRWLTFKLLWRIAGEWHQQNILP